VRSRSRSGKLGGGRIKPPGGIFYNVNAQAKRHKNTGFNASDQKDEWLYLGEGYI